MTSFVGSRHIYLENIVDERRKIIQKLRNWIECEMMTMAIFGQAYILKKNGLAKMTRVLREKCDKSQNTDSFADGKRRECCLNKNGNDVLTCYKNKNFACILHRKIFCCIYLILYRKISSPGLHATFFVYLFSSVFPSFAPTLQILFILHSPLAI